MRSHSALVDQLAVLDGPIAAMPALGAIWCYRKYTLDRKRHAEIQEQLAQRRTLQEPPADMHADAPAAIAQA